MNNKNIITILFILIVISGGYLSMNLWILDKDVSAESYKSNLKNSEWTSDKDSWLFFNDSKFIKKDFNGNILGSENYLLIDSKNNDNYFIRIGELNSEGHIGDNHVLKIIHFGKKYLVLKASAEYGNGKLIKLKKNLNSKAFNYITEDKAEYSTEFISKYETGEIKELKKWSDVISDSYSTKEYINKDFGYSLKYPEIFNEIGEDNFILKTSEFDDNTSLFLHQDIYLNAISQIDIIGEFGGEDYTSRFSYKGWIDEKELIEKNPIGQIECVESLVEKEGAFSCEIKEIRDKKFLFKYVCDTYKCGYQIPKYVIYQNDYRYEISAGFQYNTYLSESGVSREDITLDNDSKIKVIEEMIGTLNFFKPEQEAFNITDEKLISFIQDNYLYSTNYYNQFELGQKDGDLESLNRFVYTDRYNNDHIAEYPDSGLRFKLSRKDSKSGKTSDIIFNEDNIDNDYSIVNVLFSSCCQLIEIKGINKDQPNRTYFFGRGI